uniref:Translation initiation factor IF-2, chloroplastic n=1 Tax=Osmundea sinicola TaxID=290685 RepID=A0A7L4WNP7_9FLOR|nr:translation initiation factor 2 [Osmundea sinicola]QFR99890.1 translation initiation factor 2 [Osmundea sinicola]
MVFLNYNYIYSPLFINYIKQISLYSSEYADNILYLNMPKLITHLDSKIIDSINVHQSNQDVNISINSDNHMMSRKHKEKNYSQVNVENKKNKNKISKKKRDLANNEIFVETKDHLFVKDSLDLSLLKSRKLNNKTKKKNKLKIQNLKGSSDLFSLSDNNKNSHQDKSFNTVIINSPLTVEELSLKLDIPEAEIITYLFLNKGISVTLNQSLDITLAKEVAVKYNFTVLDVDDSLSNYSQLQHFINPLDTTIRNPIITILGHVDHGKTTLLDAILKTNLVRKESGGITQTIRGYEMEFNYDSKIYKLVFLDTPGHSSFKEMRIRGAKITDIALLVIAFNDGLRPQTVEAINYIKTMDLNCIVVITKTDNVDQDINVILQDLTKYGLHCEPWGGYIPVVQVSALTGRNIFNLLSKICIMSEVKKFVANPNQLASGTILESYLDKKRGPIAYVVVQNGTLKVGDVLISSGIYGKVKSLIDVALKKVSLVLPSTVVQILGFSDLPDAGSKFEVVNSEKEAKRLCLDYSHQISISNILKRLNNSIYKDNTTTVKEIKMLIKSDTQGSLEAILDLLLNLPQSQVKVRVVSASCGTIANSDIELALVTNSIMIAFNIDISSTISKLIKDNSLIVKNFDVIYDLSEYVQAKMLDLIEPNYDKVFVGRASVRTVFNINNGVVAGCYVDQGKLIKMCHLCVSRNNQVVYEGILNSLKVIKDDVNEVIFDNECGLMCNYDSWKTGDIIDAYQLVPRKKTLI